MAGEQQEEELYTELSLDTFLAVYRDTEFPLELASQLRQHMF